jgi:hypothetical protein
MYVSGLWIKNAFRGEELLNKSIRFVRRGPAIVSLLLLFASCDQSLLIASNKPLAKLKSYEQERRGPP